MATVVIRENNRRNDIEYFLRDVYDVDFEYRPSVPLDEFNIEESLKNQSRVNPLIDEVVAKYELDYKRGDPMPPLVAYQAARGRAKRRRLVLIDGNNRLAAARKAGLVSLDIYEVGPGTDQEVIDEMAATLNASHGHPLTWQEKFGHALRAIDNGTPEDEAAEKFGLDPKGRFKTELTKVKVERKALDAGVNPGQWNKISTTKRTRLLNLKFKETFKGAAELVYKADLSVAETNELVKALNAATSFDMSKTLLEDARRHYRERITGNAPNNSKRAPAAKMRFSGALSNILSLPENVDAIADTYRGPDRVKQADRVDEAIAMLSKLAAALRS